MTERNVTFPGIDEAARFIRERLGGAPPPTLGVVLGSALGGFADGLEGRVGIPFDQIPNMPSTTVAGHAGVLSFGRRGGSTVACLGGRAHLYEGHSAERVVFGTRLLAELGARFVILTNAAGGIAEGLSPGDFLLVTDHLNLTGHNPLVGFLEDSRFVDLGAVYDPAVCDAAREAARLEGVTLREGVYAGLLGPSYETPAEVRMLKTLGAHAVGMSTVLEAIALRHVGVRVGAMSLISNLAAGLSSRVLSHGEVTEAAHAAAERFQRIVGRWLDQLVEMGP